MRKILLTLILVVLAAASIVAVDSKKEVMRPIHQFVDSLNKGDLKTMAAACAEQTSIIDEFPPHEWHGAGACSNWANDYNTDAQKNGITDGALKLGIPRHIDIAGDNAYVVVPANYTFKQKGKLVREIRATFTVALHNGEGGWRITGWSWSKP
ncbi:MAG: nuclear transport factor 2 family protein [bacterium]